MNSIIKIYSFTMLIAMSFAINAGQVSDTFTAGDTLTATKMVNIKTAVNDNDTNVSANTSNIGSNSTNINAQFSGDGSAGDLTISAATNWNDSPPANPNFRDITIDAGQTLTVTAGSTIRCSGTFTNYGVLNVLQGARMASLDNFAFGATPDISSTGHPGDSFRPASGGAYYTDGIITPKFIQGGMGGNAIPKATTSTSFNSFRIGGGSGSGFRTSSSDGAGGGLVKIYCAGDIVNPGTINAVGSSSSTLSGGGGGGIVILGSTSSVDNSIGTINVNGGNGGNSFSFGGAGGGGGGGIVVFVAPTVTAGTVNFSGGAIGLTTSQVSNKHRYGGGAGGASGGDGGNGSDIGPTATVTANPASVGIGGYSTTILANPSYMMH